MSNPEPPTLAEIEQALANFNSSVDKEDVLAGTVYAALCTGVLDRLAACLRSGEYALVSRANRIEVVDSVEDIENWRDIARRLLQLETP